MPVLAGCLVFVLISDSGPVDISQIFNTDKFIRQKLSMMINSVLQFTQRCIIVEIILAVLKQSFLNYHFQVSLSRNKCSAYVLAQTTKL